MKSYDFGIVGFGPAGIGVAISLAQNDQLGKTVCFERGLYKKSVECLSISRGTCCNASSCHVISGVGGASNLSSGKISDFPAGSGLADFFTSQQELESMLTYVIHFLKDKIDLKKVEIDETTKALANLRYSKMNIEYKYYDVYEFQGSKYQQFLVEEADFLLSKGLSLYDGTEVVDINKNPSDTYFYLDLKTPTGKEQVAVKQLVIATGALEIQDDLISKFEQSDQSEYEIGVRVETKSKALSGALSSHGDLKLKKDNGRTYCVTENGVVITYKTKGLFFLEGCKLSANSSYSNLAVLLKYHDNDLLLEFLNNYSELFNGCPIKQTYLDYLAGRTSNKDVQTTCPITSCGDINLLFPTEINIQLKSFIEKVLKEGMGLSLQDMTLIAPELKMLRHIDIFSNFEVLPNLYLVGAATGRFRGILQSMCSGIKCGENMLRR